MQHKFLFLLYRVGRGDRVTLYQPSWILTHFTAWRFGLIFAASQKRVAPRCPTPQTCATPLAAKSARPLRVGHTCPSGDQGVTGRRLPAIWESGVPHRGAFTAHVGVSRSTRPTRIPAQLVRTLFSPKCTRRAAMYSTRSGNASFDPTLAGAIAIVAVVKKLARESARGITE